MTVNGIGDGGFGAAGVWGGQRPDRSQMQTKFFEKADANDDGGIDKTELGDAIAQMKERSGSTAEVDVDGLLSKLDSSGDGSISQAELSENDRALFDTVRQQLGGHGFRAGGAPLPQGQNADELFASLDSDEDGSISKDELTAALTAQLERATNQYRSLFAESTTSSSTVSLTA